MKTQQEKVFDLLENTGTNWSIEKLPLLTADNRATESFGLFRNDNKKWMGTVGNQYSPMQNSILAETIVEAANNLGLDNIRGGILQEGRKIYYQVGITDAHVGPDVIKRNITALNSHDGTSAIAFGSSSTVVICTNTFYRAFSELSKFRHTISAEIRVKIAMESLSNAILKDQKLIENFSRMAEQPMKQPVFQSLVKKLFDVDLTASQKDTSTRKLNQLRAFNNAVEKEVNRHGGATLWSLFNAVTYYTNHVETVDSKGIKSDILQNVMVGSGEKKNDIAYDVIMNWIEENTAVPVFVEK